MPLLLASTPSMQLQGWLPLLVLALPLLVSIRELHGGREFVYHWEDVPPHVRRIAERERQRVELETARQIQSSILPELPPQLGGVALAHAYLPATEVGGDFYDVLALEDGRVALAVGDVAGHGVSSGLVMSMAKSALAVQVTFNPSVEAVFTTLNRMNPEQFFVPKLSLALQADGTIVSPPLEDLSPLLPRDELRRNMEDSLTWHYKSPDAAQLERALGELGGP